MQKSHVRYCVLAHVLVIAGCGGSPEKTNGVPTDGGSSGADDGTDGSPFHGVDAGDADGGTLDAGVVVGGPDAGGQYDGASDAGTVDAGSDAGSSDGGHVDASIEAGTADAGAVPTRWHRSFPLVEKNGSLVIASPQVVTITFASDANGPLLQAFADWVVEVHLLVDGRRRLRRRTGDEPRMGTVSDLPAATVASGGTPQSYIFSKILDGTLPAPQPPTVAGTPGNTIYMIYYPPGIPGVLPMWGAGAFTDARNCTRTRCPSRGRPKSPDRFCGRSVGLDLVSAGSRFARAGRASDQRLWLGRLFARLGRDGVGLRRGRSGRSLLQPVRARREQATGCSAHLVHLRGTRRVGPVPAGIERRLPQCVAFP